MSGSDERLARNEVVFRRANEAIRGRVAGRPDLLTFLCECSDTSCKENIRLTYDEYEAVRAKPHQFAIAGGHAAAGETIVDEFGRYAVVEKIGDAERVAEEEDPRAR